jgi:hypothetical protein
VEHDPDGSLVVGWLKALAEETHVVGDIDAVNIAVPLLSR